MPFGASGPGADEQPGSLLAQPLCYAQADARRGRGDDRDLALQAAHVGLEQAVAVRCRGWSRVGDPRSWDFCRKAADQGLVPGSPLPQGNRNGWSDEASTMPGSPKDRRLQVKAGPS